MHAMNILKVIFNQIAKLKYTYEPDIPIPERQKTRKFTT